MTKANEEKVEVLYHGWVIANTRGLWILELPVESDNILRPDSLEEAKKFIDIELEVFRGLGPRKPV